MWVICIILAIIRSAVRLELCSERLFPRRPWYAHKLSYYATEIKKNTKFSVFPSEISVILISVMNWTKSLPLGSKIWGNQEIIQGRDIDQETHRVPAWDPSLFRQINEQSCSETFQQDLRQTSRVAALYQNHTALGKIFAAAQTLGWPVMWGDSKTEEASWSSSNKICLATCCISKGYCSKFLRHRRSISQFKASQFTVISIVELMIFCMDALALLMR